MFSSGDGLCMMLVLLRVILAFAWVARSARVARLARLLRLFFHVVVLINYFGSQFVHSLGFFGCHAICIILFVVDFLLLGWRRRFDLFRFDLFILSCLLVHLLRFSFFILVRLLFNFFETWLLWILNGFSDFYDSLELAVFMGWRPRKLSRR